VVEFGSTVVVNASVNSNSESHTYVIVGNEEAEPQKGRISHESPLGRALLGKKLGAKVLVKTPKGEKELSITHVS
jgi:transcription elongation factor GreA